MGKNKIKKMNHEFFSGILCALAIVSLADYETLYDEIVSSAGAENLVKTARKKGLMRWSGLTKYGYGRGTKEGIGG